MSVTPSAERFASNLPIPDAEIDDLTESCEEYSAQELKAQMYGVMAEHPESADLLSALMRCLGDIPEADGVDTAFPNTDDPVLELLFCEGSLGTDAESINIILEYMYTRRRQQLEDAYNTITQHRPLPDLFKVLAILDSPVNPSPRLQTDRFALLGLQASILQRTLTRYGLVTASQVHPALNNDAWREYTMAARALEEDPPVALVQELEQPNDEDFFIKKLSAIYEIREEIAELLGLAKTLSGIDNDTGQPHEMGSPFTVTSTAVISTKEINPDQGYDPDDVDLEPAVIIESIDGTTGIMQLGDIAKSFARDRLFLSDEMLFRIALLAALAEGEDVDGVKLGFAAACISLASNRTIELYGAPGDTSLDSLFKDTLALSSVGNAIEERAASETWPIRGSQEDLSGSLGASNVDDRTFKYRGTVEQITDTSIYNRMLVFDPANNIAEGTELRGDNYDLEIRTELPLVDHGGSRHYILPYLGGFDVVGYHPVDASSNEHIVRYVVAQEDPYSLDKIEVDRMRLFQLADRLDAIGLSDAADSIRQPECQVLADVFRNLENSLVYGNGRRRITIKATELEDLRYFVEDGQMIGVCSLFAAIAAFSLEKLVPESNPRIIGGHRINPWGISEDGHAQVTYGLPGQRAQIMDLNARGVRTKRRVTEADTKDNSLEWAVTREEVISTTAGNMLIHLSGALEAKYRVRGTPSLARYLANLPLGNFGRQLYSLLLKTRSLQPSDTKTGIAEVKMGTTQLREQLSAWRSNHDETRNNLTRHFGDWNPEETDFLLGIISNLEKALL